MNEKLNKVISKFSPLITVFKAPAPTSYTIVYHQLCLGRISYVPKICVMFSTFYFVFSARKLHNLECLYGHEASLFELPFRFSPYFFPPPLQW